MAIDREKIAARLHPEIVDRPGTRWSRRMRRGISRWFRTVFHALFLTLFVTLFVKPFRRLNQWSRDHWRGIAVFLFALIVWGSIHVYWYNRLIRLEYDVLTAWAQIEVEEQRRFHIQKNVVDLVIGYAEHERALMNELTELRTRARGDEAPKVPLRALPAKQLDALFPDIMMVAEQYPNLRLTENFQQFSEAIIATETRIAERTAEYNRVVNMYTTVLRQFPGNIFASIWGFKEYDYHRPTLEARTFRPLNYRGKAMRPAELDAPPPPETEPVPSGPPVKEDE